LKLAHFACFTGGVWGGSAAAIPHQYVLRLEFPGRVFFFTIGRLKIVLLDTSADPGIMTGATLIQPCPAHQRYALPRPGAGSAFTSGSDPHPIS
jgi:hypothetical protein